MGFVDTILGIPQVDRDLNRHLINYFAMLTSPRPRPYSLWSADPKPAEPEVAGSITDYTSWPSLTNKRYSGRHLPPAAAEYTNGLPKDAAYKGPGQPLGEITALFARKDGMRMSRSSLLFMFFAQWFTDSVLRVDVRDRRMTTSNHDVDLCQIYGLDEETARILRAKRGGKLRTQMIGGEEYPDYLCEPDGRGGFKIRDMYLGLPAAKVGIDLILTGSPANRAEKLYATGLERGNSTIGYSALNTIFMREHNRLAGALAQRNPSWGDERLFQTARNINIVLLLKLVVEDYINHILGYHLFHLDHEFAEAQVWYRANWMAIEFDLLYRWHGLAPDVISMNGGAIEPCDFRNNNALLEQVGVDAVIECVSSQPAGRVSLFNSPEYLWAAEYQSIKMSRDFRLQPYNAYRQCFGLPPLTEFSQLTKDTAVQAELKRLYGEMKNVEYLVGLFAEDADPGHLFGSLLNRMVAYDAFTQIFTNPLLSKNVYNADTFTKYGLDEIEGTTSVADLVNRNVRRSVKASLGVQQRGT